MTENVDLEMREEPKKRPVMLTVLAVLSLIVIGFGLLGVLFQAVGGKASDEELLDQQVELTKQISQFEKMGSDFLVEFFTQAKNMLLEINEHFYLVVFVSLITYMSGLIGVIMMLKGRKLGFHLYIIYNLLSIGAIYLYISPANVPVASILFNVSISGLFIFLYSRTLSWMK